MNRVDLDEIMYSLPPVTPEEEEEEEEDEEREEEEERYQACVCVFFLKNNAVAKQRGLIFIFKMDHPFSRRSLRVPPGFPALLESLTVEVLREQPRNLARFAAQHFERLLEQRIETEKHEAAASAQGLDHQPNNDRPFAGELLHLKENASARAKPATVDPSHNIPIAGNDASSTRSNRTPSTQTPVDLADAVGAEPGDQNYITAVTWFCSSNTFNLPLPA
uniref:RIIa domain-containing protein n=2 Tax=Eptatretus burgeri TaxID=7764 RepID=A0A8C4N027_EPTBU